MTNEAGTKQREITTTIENGRLTITAIGEQPIAIDAGMLTAEIRTYAMLHGLKQKIVDAAALGRDYTTSEKYKAMMDVFNRITDPDNPSWNARGEGDSAPTGLLFRALCRLYSAKSPATIREFLEGKTKSEQAALRKNPKIAAIIETIKSESMKTGGVNSDALLAGLEDGNE